jgi:hypothetical protein
MFLKIEEFQRRPTDAHVRANGRVRVSHARHPPSHYDLFWAHLGLLIET